MARKRIELPPGADAIIEAGMRRGDGVDAIAKTLGADVSNRTIGRRMRQLRTGTEKVAPVAQILPEDADVPDDTSADELDFWIANLEKAGKNAAAIQDAAGLMKLGNTVLKLYEYRQKMAPVARPSAEESPDMLAAKERARAAFYKLAKQAASGIY